METEEQVNEQIYMEINEQIFYVQNMFLRDVAFSLNFDDDVYQQVLKDFGIKRLRYKMGGDEGIHSIVKNTEEDGN
jgi:hypothetical protein